MIAPPRPVQADWDRELAAIELCGFGIHDYRLFARINDENGVGDLTIDLEVTDSDGEGETTWVRTRGKVYGCEIRAQVWSLFLAALRHEAGENFWVDGERPFYPDHPDNPPED